MATKAALMHDTSSVDIPVRWPAQRQESEQLYVWSSNARHAEISAREILLCS
jgi:hypothetical protein